MGVWGYYVDGLGTNFLALGVFWLVCSLYFLRRTVRDEKRVQGQEPALADQARAWSSEISENESAPSRPAP